MGTDPLTQASLFRPAGPLLLAAERRGGAAGGGRSRRRDLPFRIGPSDKVATAGSCFAQHIARHLKSSGFTYLVTERAHPLINSEVAESAGYGLFTARYGNIYTSRQLLQLFLRCYGGFTPEMPLDDAEGPPRRRVPSDGPARRVPSVRELLADRAHHLKCVRAAFETLDVLVFTLGLTECWVSRRDGTVYPVCPGVSGGNSTRPLRLSQPDGRGGRRRSLRVHRSAAGGQSGRQGDPDGVAGAAGGDGHRNHVLTATTLSKAILRVAADIVCGSD